MEVLESFLAVGCKNKTAVLVNLEDQNVEAITSALKELYSSLRILGLKSMLLEAELLEAILTDPEKPFTEDLDQRIRRFCMELAIALEHAEVELQKYRESLNV